MEVVVFTNGCFDILHPGHIELLEKAKKLGTKLIVGINSDESVRSIKGNTRPIISEEDRAAILLGLSSVDEVIVFNEPTPQQIIEKIKPNILVKGGDWEPDQIIGAEFVKKNGGEVFSIPLKEGYSTSSIVEKIEGKRGSQITVGNFKGKLVEFGLKQHLDVFNELLEKEIQSIEKSGIILSESIGKGKKILVCGEDGKANVVQYFVEMLNARFSNDDKSPSAIAIKTDTSAFYENGNYIEKEYIFSKQVEALANKDDVLIGISNSGNTPNIISAIMLARENGCLTIGLTGAKGKKLASICDSAVLVPSEEASRIQEAHITIGHLWCEMLEAKN